MATARAAGANVTLQLDPKNARRHSDRNKKAIRQSLEAVGPFRSIAVDGEDIIRAGNGVYEQAQALGLKVRVVEAQPDELIAVKRPDLTGKEAVRAAALDNIVADTSSYDYDAALLAEIANDDAVVKALANEDAKLRDLLAKAAPKEEKTDVGELIDKAAQLQEKWQVARGDVWSAGHAADDDLPPAVGLNAQRRAAKLRRRLDRGGLPPTSL